MEILFKCLQSGTRYYSVRLHGQELFVGTPDECERYIQIHNNKVLQQQADEKRPQRNKPVSIRTYRQARTTA